MPIEWRIPGAGVTTIDLGKLEGDQIVIHYGGALTSVDAYTFANSLVAFADTVRAINHELNPGQNVEVRLEAIGPGSYRAVVRRIHKGLGGFFSRGMEAMFWGILATVILKAIDPDKLQVTVNTDEVIVEVGGDRVIIPRNVYDKATSIEDAPEVRKSIRRTFEVVQQDEAVENFGLTPRLEDTTPVLQIHRKDFARLSELPIVVRDTEKRRSRQERALLRVTKAWLSRGQHKWAFEWNGVPVSAKIKDEAFWDKVEARDYLIGSGDVLDADLSFDQDFDSATGTWANDVNTYAVVKVRRIIAKDGQQMTMEGI